MTAEIYDVAVVGCGAAGLFAAMELATQSGLSVLLLEQVKRLHDTRNVSNGWMGGSAKSDVRMFIDPGFGGEITDLSIIEYFLAHIQSLTSYSFKLQKGNLSQKLMRRIQDCGMEVDEPTTITIPSDKLIGIEMECRGVLNKVAQVKTNCQVNHINKKGRVFELDTGKGLFKARKCVLAMGRGGAHWLRNISGDFKSLNYQNNRYDLGVRLEFPHQAIKEFVSKSPSFRLRWDDYRTSAVSSRGTVEMENVFDVKTSNSRSMNGKHTLYSSFAILKTFQEEDALNKVLNLVQIANILADGQLLKEPVGRILNGKSILTPLKEFDQLKEGISRILELFPNLSKRCSLYAPEARLNTIRFDLSKHMESDIKGLYIVGDMSGQTKSFVQSACSGILAAKHIISVFG